MDLYINSVGFINGAGNNIGEGAVGANDYNAVALPSVEPDYKAYIPVMQLRRMSRAVRMGVVASKVAMEHVGIEQPDAITVGTAYGCLQDTERFLDKLVEQDEQMLTPTSFIQSTHNTVSGQIALLAKCNGHNLTFVHKGHSFEHALIDAQLYLEEHQAAHVLVGGLDELTEHSTKALQIAGVATQTPLTANDVLKGGNTGTVVGEGAAFFSITQQPLTDKYIKIKSLTIFKTDSDVQAIEKIKTAIDFKDVDTVLLGNSGDIDSESFYTALDKELPTTITKVLFKQFCGECPVASSFALGLLAEYVRTGNMPNLEFSNSAPQKVALINNFKQYYSCWELALSV